MKEEIICMFFHRSYHTTESVDSRVDEVARMIGFSSGHKYLTSHKRTCSFCPVVRVKPKYYHS